MIYQISGFFLSTSENKRLSVVEKCTKNKKGPRTLARRVAEMLLGLEKCSVYKKTRGGNVQIGEGEDFSLGKKEKIKILDKR